METNLKLTEERLRGNVFDGNPSFTLEEIKQILENQEKAEKYDEIVQTEESWQDYKKWLHGFNTLEQENKQLKEGLTTSRNAFHLQINPLKQKLEKIEKLITEESDLDLHPDAEDFDVNRVIMSLLEKFKEILKEKS